MYSLWVRAKRECSRSCERMKILVLISALATFACWLAAIATRKSGSASDYQAHSSKFKSVLSSVYLGREALKKGIKVTLEQFELLIQHLFQMADESKIVYPHMLNFVGIGQGLSAASSRWSN